MLNSNVPELGRCIGEIMVVFVNCMPSNKTQSTKIQAARKTQNLATFGSFSVEKIWAGTEEENHFNTKRKYLLW